MENNRLVRWVVRFFRFLAGLNFFAVCVLALMLVFFIYSSLTGSGYHFVVEALGNETGLGYRPILVILTLLFAVVEGFIAYLIWKILAQVVHHMGAGTLASVPSLSKIERLPRLFLLSYFLGVFGVFEEVFMRHAFPHLTNLENLAVQNSLAAGTGNIHIELSKFIVPNFDGAIALVLAIFSWVAVKLIKQSNNLSRTVETLQEEANLTV